MSIVSDHPDAVMPGIRPRGEVLLPPAIILLVFAMVVTAIGGFAFVSSQQQALSAVRTQSDALRSSVSMLQLVDADAAHVLNGERGALASYFRDLEMLKGQRGATLDALPEVPATLDKLLGDWNEAVNLSADGHADEARALLTERQAAQAVTDIGATAQTALQQSQAVLGTY